ncbi:nucleoid-associated protein [Gynuella sp.]|uniref:nucleoid-associated protein n=1 Tax=Gynuella sp. TaxID=2969146 RepID=UPI003D0EBB4A
MPLTNAIVHHLTQTPHAEKLHLRDTEMNLDESLKHLVNEVKSSFYNRASKQYGRFHEESGHFKALTQEWLQGSLDFTAYSSRVMQQLQLKLQETQQESDGHWLFAVEELQQERLFWLFHLKHKDGMYLTHDIELAQGMLLDFTKLGFGACINIPAFENQETDFFTVSFGFGDRSLQSTVLEFTDFTDTVDTTADTERFMAIVKAYTEQLPPEKGASYRSKAVQYCAEQDKQGETVVCQELSEVIDEEVGNTEAESLIRYIEQAEPEAKKEFIPDRKSLKRFMRYTGKSKEVSISFSNESLGSQVEFDPDNERLIINSLPAALLKQLKKD